MALAKTRSIKVGDAGAYRFSAMTSAAKISQKAVPPRRLAARPHSRPYQSRFSDFIAKSLVGGGLTKTAQPQQCPIVNLDNLGTAGKQQSREIALGQLS